MTSPIPVRERERRILGALANLGEDFGFMGFEGLSRKTGLERRQVRVDVRRLARKGLTQYGRGLWNSFGEPGGSGYCITQQGRAHFKQMEAAE